MISEDIYWRIHHLNRIDGLNAAQIAAETGLSAPTVHKWLNSDRWQPRSQPQKDSILDPHKERIRQMLRRHPYSATQIFQTLQREDAYQGSYSQLRRFVRDIRPADQKGNIELHFRPGEAMQVDFGSCGTVPCGETSRRLSVLVITLCHSRLLYAEFFTCERLEHMLTGIRHALEFFGGVPEHIIVDNCKTAVLRHSSHGVVWFHPRFSELVAHYGSTPVACKPVSPQEKGRVENGVKYVKNNFMNGRTPCSLPQINPALVEWREEIANVRVHGTTREQPVERFRRNEKHALKALPYKPADCMITESRRASKLCRVSFDSNRYSVPEKYARRQLTVRADPDRVLLYDGEKLAAEHTRSYDRNTAVVDPDHTEQMKRRRRRAREQNLQHDFLTLGPAAETFFDGLNKKQIHPRNHLRRIMTLVQMHGKAPVVTALQNAVQFCAFRAEYVEHLTFQYSAGTGHESNPLHVPRAGDAMDTRVDAPDMNQYNL